METVNQKRIIGNTLMLYIRMGLIMLISLYTSRVVLQALGVESYGIYGAVGGVVVAFSFFNNVMAAACNRYFAIELGRDDRVALGKVFSLMATVFIIIVVAIFLLSETAGLWLLKRKMVFNDVESNVVNIVYQCALASLIASTVSIPHKALIIARENMKIFAYLSVFEAGMKLLVALLIVLSPIDKLVFYSLGMALIPIGVSLYYILYCHRNYSETRQGVLWDKVLFKDIIGYSGWNTVGALAGIGRSQGLNILLNIFYGPVANAARQVAYQIYTSINQFVQSFVTASNPQITKSYSSGERTAMTKLVFQSSKFSFFLLLVMVLPVYMEAPFILELWLGNVPDNSVIFTRILLVTALVDALGYPLATAIQATGRIKWYQLFVGGALLITLPIAYLTLKCRIIAPEYIFIISLAMSVLAQIFRIAFFRKMLGVKICDYFSQVIVPIAAATVPSLAIAIFISMVLSQGITSSIVSIIADIVIVAIATWFLGMKKSERRSIVSLLKKK